MDSILTGVLARWEEIKWLTTEARIDQIAVIKMLKTIIGVTRTLKNLTMPSL
jgi:hypothetical protein